MRPRYLLSLVAAVLAGCAHHPPISEAAPPPAPAPPPIAAAAPAEIPAPIPVTSRIALCALRKGELVEFEAEVNLETGDTLVAGRPYTQLYPLTAEYAAGSQGYVENRGFTFGGACFLKYGLPRYRPPAGMRRFGTHRGLPFFSDEPATDAGRPPVMYVLVRPCEFQPYQYELVIRPCGPRMQ